MNKEKILKQIEVYKADLKATAENRDKLITAVNQHETKIQQLLGAISALEEVSKEEVVEEVVEEKVEEKVEEVTDNGRSQNTSASER